jgi:uncharacterized DUF497 family protein
MERGSAYDWDRHTKSHIAGHGVEPHEFEEVLANGPIYIETRIDGESGEEGIPELGHTNRGRVLFVAWRIGGERTRPVTALEANGKTRDAYDRDAYERRRYEEKQ